MITEAPALEPDYNISFTRDGVTIGKLDFNGDKMKFVGNADESAEILFALVADKFAKAIDDAAKVKAGQVCTP